MMLDGSCGDTRKAGPKPTLWLTRLCSFTGRLFGVVFFSGCGERVNVTPFRWRLKRQPRTQQHRFGGGQLFSTAPAVRRAGSR